ncbi:MAG: hypothetical protein ABIS01_11340 [Ferruginibacter sp.]
MEKEKLFQFFTNTSLVSSVSAKEITNEFNPKTIDENNYLLNAGKVCDEYLFWTAAS